MKERDFSVAKKLRFRKNVIFVTHKIYFIKIEFKYVKWI